MNLKIILLTILAVNAILIQSKVVRPKGRIDESCLRLVNASDPSKRCGFYECFDKRYPCGNDYWIIGWGFKYCNRFTKIDFIQNFSDNGKKILEHLNKCLPQNAENFYKSRRSVICERLDEQLNKGVEKCYTEIRDLVCLANDNDKKLFMNIMDTKDYSNINSIAMLGKIAQYCLNKYG